MRALAAHLLARSGLGFLARRLLTRRGRFVVEIHGVVSRRFEDFPAAVQPGLTRDELDAILGWIRARFPLLTASELLAGDRSGVLLTFDDGYANQALHALPILERHRAPAVLFVTTGHVADPDDLLPACRRILESLPESPPADLVHELFGGMSPDQLRTCAASPGITIGSHTVSHPFLTRCDDDQLRRELVESRRFLEEHTGRVVDLLAYPTGDHDARVATAARRAGYRAAFVEDSCGLGLGAFEIPRIGLYRADDAYLGAKLSGLFRRPLPVGRSAPEVR